MGYGVPLPPEVDPSERPGAPEPFCSEVQHGTHVRPRVNRSPRRRTSDVLFPVLAVVAIVALIVTGFKIQEFATRQVVFDVLQEQGLIP